jgi:hypothetical protein
MEVVPLREHARDLTPQLSLAVTSRVTDTVEAHVTDFVMSAGHAMVGGVVSVTS